MGAMNAAIRGVWLHGILTEFGIHTSHSIDILFDNQSTINISSDSAQKP